MEWTNDKVVSLIEMYRDRPQLWNCRLRDYKDRNKRHDALTDIAMSFGIKKEEVEKKLKYLLCHFSREVKKEKDTAKSGAGSEEVYKSKWFAYPNMAFLKDRNKAKEMTDTQDAAIRVSPEPDPVLPLKEDETPQLLEESTSSTSISTKKKRFGAPPKTLSPRSNSKNSATDAALAIMKDIHAGKSVRDQYAVFGEQIGMQIRDLPSLHARKVVKHLISNILFDAEMGKYDYPLTTSAQSSRVAYLYSQPSTFYP